MGSFPTISSISDEKVSGSLLELMLICSSDKPNVQTQSYANSFPDIDILVSVDEYILY